MFSIYRELFKLFSKAIKSLFKSEAKFSICSELCSMYLIIHLIIALIQEIKFIHFCCSESLIFSNQSQNNNYNS